MELGYNKAVCLDNNGGRSTSGNKVDVYGCNGLAAQKWTLVSEGSNRFEVKDAAGTCLDDYQDGGSGSKVIAFKCNASDHAQIWSWEASKIENTFKAVCINDPAYKTTNGTQLIVYSCSANIKGSSNELWYEAALKSATTTPSAPVSGSSGSSSSSSATSSNTTAATCPYPKPVSGVTGYTIAACEDFNSGLGDFGPYSGGGSGTVVGTGRIPSQCTVTGGMLELKQASNGATCGGWMNNFDQRYGYWEVKMRAYSSGTGSGSEPHPVLILWPGSGSWTSELDFFETDIGNSAGGYLHCISNPSQNCYSLPSNAVNYSQWHVYGIQWTPTSMTGYIDGTKWWSSSNTSSFQPLADSNLTIQLDNLSGSTPVKPGEMDIDWAHMYK